MKANVWRCGCAAGLAMMAAAGWAQDPPPVGGPGRRAMGPGAGPAAPRAESMIEWLNENPRAADRLGLTEEQKEKLKALLFEGRRELVELRARVQVAALRQAELLSQENPDQNAVMQAVEQTGQLRTELAKAQIRQLLAVRAMLTSEQRDQLRGAFRERWRQGEPGAPNRRPFGRKEGPKPPPAQ